MKSLFKKNACKECKYYIEKNGTCQSKKCAGASPYVTFWDRIFCEPRDGGKT